MVNARGPEIPGAEGKRVLRAALLSLGLQEADPLFSFPGGKLRR